MSILVQSKAGAADVTAIHNSSTAVEMVVSLDNPVVGGNTLLVFTKVECNSGNNTGIGNPATGFEFVDDPVRGTYTEATWMNGGVQIQGAGIFYIFNAPGGLADVKFHVTIPNANPLFDLGQKLAMVVVELDAAYISTSPAINGVDQQQNDTTHPPMVLTVPDHLSVPVDTDYGSPNQQSGVVIGLNAYGTDYYITGFTIFTVPDPSTPGAPSITAPVSYVFVNAARTAANDGWDFLSVWISAADVVLCPISQRGNIDYDQIGIDARHGNGNKIQYSDGTGVTGNLAVFDHCGNVTDGGAPATGTGTVTHTGALTADLPVFGNGAADIKVGTKRGNTNTAQMADNTTNPTSGNLAAFDANGNIKDSGISSVGSGNVSAAGTLTANLPVIGAGGTNVAVGTASGNTTEFATVSGALTNGHILKADASGNIVDGGSVPVAPTIAATTNLLAGDGAGNAVDAGFTNPIPVNKGGTGTTTPSLVAGTGIGITGSWPNQTVSASGAGTVTHTGALTVDQPVFGNGTDDIKVGTKTGTGTELVTASGALTQDVPLLYDASGNVVVSSKRGNTNIFQCASSTGVPATNNLASFDANGNVKDSGINTVSGGGGSLIAPVPPVVRAATLAAYVAAGSSIVITWPTGTIAGDLVYVFQGGYNSLSTTPTGWNLIDSAYLGGPNAEGTIIWRVLNNADITAGSVTLNLTASGTQNVAGAVTIQGQTPGMRTYASVRNTGTSVTLDTDGSPLTTDLAFMFSYARGSCTCSVSLGTALYQINNGATASGCLYQYSPAAIGGISPTFSFTSSLTTYQIVLVVKGNGIP